MKNSRRKFLLSAAGGSLGAMAAALDDCTHAEESDDPDGPYIMVPQRRVPVPAEADVVVCGGGPAGISAACCAARHGARVILLERWPSVGGMATNALVRSIS